MKKALQYLYEENNKIILHTSKDNVELFSEAIHLTPLPSRFNVPDKLNAIGVCEDLYKKYEKEKLLLLNTKNGKHSNVVLVKRDKIAADSLLLTSYLREMLDIAEDDSIALCRYQDLAYNRVFLQKIDHIKENNLIVSEYDYNNILCDVHALPCKYYEVYNTFSKDNIIVKKSHIFVDKTLAPGTIRLNRKQRLSLGLELPAFLTNDEWKRLTCTDNGLEKEETDLIRELYGSEDHYLDKSASYDKKSKVKKIIANRLTGEIRIIPVVESVKSKRKGLIKRLCDFYVGKSTISLICRRPYEIDEGLDIVRMTKSNMNLLGIDEMDKVILQYRSKKTSCRVLELEDNDSFFETNLPVSPDLVIGIPAHLRKKLAIADLSSAIKIDRDTAFIFKKNINEQIIPVLLTLFSTNLFTDSSIITSALLSLVAIPIVLYFNLSSKRNMRA